MNTVDHSRSRLEDGPSLEKVTYREFEFRLEQIEELVDRSEFANRSEAIRTAVESLVENHADSQSSRLI
ncbi:ribbon-helix-helix domain-containing protein [Halovivax sp.]|uniref:ribbon-helix-helix domain-containing protein n=1 Tax=Halovivax sp. TaxID=1935978 RepID=UPI0025BC1CCC|nr:ribbon-helix-helix domain-containing protein [Halovivax sp.]